MVEPNEKDEPNKLIKSGAWARFDAFWRPPMLPQRLASLRILIGLFATVYLSARLVYFADYSKLPLARFKPVGVVSLLDAPLAASITWPIAIITCLFGALFTLGYRYRISGVGFAALTLWLTSYRSSWGMIFHTENLMVMHLLALSLCPAADTWSWDGRGATPEASARYGWSVKLISTITVAAYLVAGVAKLRNTGLAWITSDFLRNYIAYDALRKSELGSIHSPLGPMLAARGWIFKPLAAFSLVVELCAPLALLPRLGRAWVVCVVLFHAGVLAVMAILFPYPLFVIGLASFLAPERWLEYLQRRWRQRFPRSNELGEADKAGAAGG